MATLGFGIIVHILLVQTGSLTGGPDGIGEIPRLSIFGWAIDTDARWYWVISGTLLLVVLLALNLMDSRTGRALRALHGAAVAASAMGIDTAKAKTAVFVLAALTAALAGGLFAHQQAFVSPDSFNFFVSIELVTMVVLGGMASTYGAILGAVILTFLPELLVVFEDYEVIIFGAILMLIMIFMPQGIVGGLRALMRWPRLRAARTARLTQDAA
jgi:branched-chain amino acid transport system permease protein